MDPRDRVAQLVRLQCAQSSPSALVNRLPESRRSFANVPFWWKANIHLSVGSLSGVQLIDGVPQPWDSEVKEPTHLHWHLSARGVK